MKNRKVTWGSREFDVIEKPTPHILIDAMERKPDITGRWGLKTDKVPKACTIDVLHLAPYKGCTVGCEFCSLPQYRGYNLLQYQHGVSVVFDRYDEWLDYKLAQAKFVHTFDFGADADIFMEVNDKYKLAEKCMSVLNNYNVPFSVTSKCRFPDAAIEELAKNRDSWAQISIVTLDPPDVEALADNMNRLKKAGVRVTARVQPYILGHSPLVGDMLGALKALGFDNIVFGFLRAPMGRGKKLLERYSTPEGFNLVDLYHEKFPGYWQLDTAIQRKILRQVKSACEKYKLKLGLCDVYEKRDDGSIVSLQSEFGSCQSCECVNGYAYIKRPGADVFSKVKGCPGNCLLCPEDPPCGVPEFAASVMTNIDGYQRLAKHI